MISFSIFSSKKAQVELSLQQIIGLVIAVVIVIASFAFFLGLMNIFTGPPDSGSQATLNILNDIVVALYSPHNTNESCYLVAEYIDGDWGIVGMNANDVTSSTVSSFTSSRLLCAIGQQCVMETCGVNDKIDKPTTCGPGPCLCLCDAGGATGIGDVDGNDCGESNARCMRLNRNIGFTTFYLTSTDVGECTHQANIGGRNVGLCDLVIDGESCGATNRGAQYSLVIQKTNSRDGAGGALLFDLIPESDRTTMHPNVVTDCRRLVDDIRNVRNVPVEDAPSSASSGSAGGEDTLNPSLAGRDRPISAS